MARKEEYLVNRPMHNPPHPGAVLKNAVIDALDLTVTEAAARLDVDRVSLSRVLNEKASISVEMALRLGRALDTSPEMWINMQRAYDLWHAQHNPSLDLSRVRRFEGNGTGANLL